MNIPMGLLPNYNHRSIKDRRDTVCPRCYRLTGRRFSGVPRLFVGEYRTSHLLWDGKTCVGAHVWGKPYEWLSVPLR